MNLGSQAMIFDSLTQLKDAGLVAASAAAQVGGSAKILDISASLPSTAVAPEMRGTLVIDVTALEVATGDEVHDHPAGIELVFVRLGHRQPRPDRTRCGNAHAGRRGGVHHRPLPVALHYESQRHYVPLPAPLHDCRRHDRHRHQLRGLALQAARGVTNAITFKQSV